MRHAKTIVMCSTLSVSSCGERSSPETKESKTEKKTEAPNDQAVEVHECGIDFFFCFFLVILGSFLQLVGLWRGLANAGKWLIFESYESIRAWARRQEGEDK